MRLRYITLESDQHMKRIVFTSALSLTLGLASLSAQTGKIPHGFKPIFNGKDLKGWHVSRINHHGTTLDARVENGEFLIGQNPIGEGGILLTDKLYRDFELYLEVKPDWGCDGGIFLRSNEDGNAYQITIDYMPKNIDGGLYYGRHSGDERERPAAAPDWEKIWKRDEWNSFRIRMTGEAPKVDHLDERAADRRLHRTTRATRWAAYARHDRLAAAFHQSDDAAVRAGWRTPLSQHRHQGVELAMLIPQVPLVGACWAWQGWSSRSRRRRPTASGWNW